MKASSVLHGVMTRVVVVACVVSALTLGVSDTVTAETECAGVTDQSRLRGMEPVPDAERKVFPLVVIHGITGSADAFEQTVNKSMAGTSSTAVRSILDLMAGEGDRSVIAGLPHTCLLYTSDAADE